jgi:hypothetical protein
MCHKHVPVSVWKSYELAIELNVYYLQSSAPLINIPALIPNGTNSVQFTIVKSEDPQ